MHCTFVPKILIVLLLAALSSAAQTKAPGEVDAVKCWTYPTGEASGQILVTDGTGAFVGLYGGKVEALSLDGRKTWTSDLGGEIRSNILPFESSLLLVTATAANGPGKTGDSILRSLSKETGITSWTLKLSPAERYYLGSSNGSVIIVFKSGAIQAFDARDGTPRWKREIAESFVAEPIFSVGKVAVATASAQLFTVSLTNGEMESMRKIAFRVTALGETDDAAGIVGDERGNVAVLVKNVDKPYWKFKSGGQISQVAGAGENVLAISHDNFVYLLSGRTGSVLWKKRMPGRVSSAAVYAGKYVVLSGIEEHGAVILELSSGRVAGQMLLGADETVVSIEASTKALIVLTNSAAHGFSLNGCPK